MSSPLFGVVGWKNSGKTTLMARLVGELTRRGYAVSVVKHAHEKFEIDHAGRDSFKLREAGAREVALSSPRRFALMRELGRRGVNEVLVEGGARLNGALVAAGLVDELLVYFAPCLVYDPALGMAALPEGLARLADRIPFAFDDIVRVGTDLRVRARALHKED